MEPGSSSISAERAQYHQKIEPFLPRKGHDPFELRSWAKRTGFVSTSFSMEHNKRNENAELITEKGGPRSEIELALNKNGNGNDRAKRTGVVSTSFSMEHNKRNENAQLDMEKGLVMEPTTERRSEIEPVLNKNGNENDCDEVGSLASEETGEEKRDDDGREWGGSTSKLKIGLTEFPGYVPLIYYGLQHYFSLAGSLIFIPLIIVPAMGGTDKDTAYVISTMLLVSGITTILHSYFGTRLPLVQGSSFVYLAPALVIINSEEFRNLTEHKFRHVMRELQGAIVVGSIFQSILGFSGLMSLLVRFINPVVVAPTVAAVGLAFFSYGFPQAGNCVETSVPLILLIFILTLHLRGVSIAGNHVFRIYAVPMSVIIIWAYAFFLTAGGAYNYKGCRPDIPSSNILNEACIKHAYTMKHCRTDVSNACRTAAWVRIPYPLQWGIPVFRLKTSLMMIFVSLVASVDSVGTYHSTSIRINLKTPTTGIVSRGIGLEGFCSILAGLWGTGTGSTTLTENVHTINTTKVASRRAVEIGAVILILFSFIGKVGAILASIPQALAAAVLCFVWALIVALGFSTLRYCQTGSFRNMAIVGFSLFLGFSIPAYVQQYEPETVLILPSYLIPYAAASTGQAHIGSEQLDFAINGLLSLNMVVTFLVALVLDNTVPGSKQERGVYVWSRVEDLMMESSSLSPYSLPKRVSHLFSWAKCLR